MNVGQVLAAAAMAILLIDKKAVMRYRRSLITTYRSSTNNKSLDVDLYIYIAAIAAWLEAESDPSNEINIRIEIALNDTVCN